MREQIKPHLQTIRQKIGIPQAPETAVAEEEAKKRIAKDVEDAFKVKKASHAKQ